jgi:LysM repeat protein
VFSLLFGCFVVPVRARADLLSTLFGNNVSASTNPVVSNAIGTNSQNIELLQANISSATVIQDKKDKNSKDKKLDDNKDINIDADNALVPATGPTGVSDGTNDEDISSDQISVYVVRENDSIAKIAEMFGVTSNTILWANDMKKGDKLVPGTVLIILPVSGLKITVIKGDTLKSIAKKYNADTSDIAGFNGIAEDSKLALGDELIIPDGELKDEGSAVSVPKTTGGGYVKTPINYNIAGYFINPVPGYKYRSQGLHDHGGIDLAADKGTPILAAATGTVAFARNGYNGGYGNMVIINHPNGTTTLYGHMSKILTHTGENVSKGETIGQVGSTGHSTGSHLHFKVTGAKNPGGTTPMSWASN